jgi:hypothetical protein
MTQHEYMQPRRQDAGAGMVQWLVGRHGPMMAHRLIGGSPRWSAHRRRWADEPSWGSRLPPTPKLFPFLRCVLPGKRVCGDGHIISRCPWYTTSAHGASTMAWAGCSVLQALVTGLESREQRKICTCVCEWVCVCVIVPCLQAASVWGLKLLLYAALSC